MRNLNYYIPGILMISFALLIIAVPEILVAFVAAVMVLLGIGLLTLGHNMRKAEIRLKKPNASMFEDNIYGHRFVRSPIFARWYRKFDQ